MSERFHVLDYWCNDGKWHDHGAFDFYWQAGDQIRALVAEGMRGGCRCKKGWEILPCSQLPKQFVGHESGGFVQGRPCEDFSRAKWIDVEDYEFA